MVAVGEPVALGMVVYAEQLAWGQQEARRDLPNGTIVYAENSQFGADRCPRALPMLFITCLLLGAFALAPTISLYGPRMLLFYFGGTVAGACIFVFGEVTTWVSTGAWLIYLRGVVVIFLFFAFSASNTPRLTLMGTRLAYLVGAVASCAMGVSTPLLLGPPPLIALVSAVGGDTGAGSVLWLGMLLFMVLLILQETTWASGVYNPPACRAGVAVVALGTRFE